MREDLNDRQTFLQGVSDQGWQVRDLHPTRGVKTVAQIVETALLGHIEEHVGQLEAPRTG